jgi:predicted metallopeptidase
MTSVKNITHKKIPKNIARGLAYCDTGNIVIDERLKGQDHLYILIHEILHIQNIQWSEIKVIGHAQELAKLLWENNYRRVDL